MAGELVEELFQLGGKPDEVTAFIAGLLHKNVSEEASLADIALNRIVEYAASNPTKFLVGERSGFLAHPSTTHRIVGKIFPAKGSPPERLRAICIIKSEFTDLMGEWRFDEKRVLREFRERRWLVTESDRFTKQVRIDKGKSHCVCLSKMALDHYYGEEGYRETPA